MTQKPAYHIDPYGVGPGEPEKPLESKAHVSCGQSPWNRDAMSRQEVVYREWESDLKKVSGKCRDIRALSELLDKYDEEEMSGYEQEQGYRDVIARFLRWSEKRLSPPPAEPV